MSDLILEKLKNELIESVKTMFDKKTSPYDTEAVVTRIDGDTAYVHIEGGVSETPVRRTINAKKGDKVQVRLSSGRAWLTGNDTAPPTDDTKAKAADAHAGKAMKKAVKAEEKAKQSGKTATLYVTEMDEDVGVFVHPKGTPLDPTDSDARGVQITEDVDIIRGGESVAEFGESARIGKETDRNLNVSSSGFIFNELVSWFDGMGDYHEEVQPMMRIYVTKVPNTGSRYMVNFVGDSKTDRFEFNVMSYMQNGLHVKNGAQFVSDPTNPKNTDDIDVYVGGYTTGDYVLSLEGGSVTPFGVDWEGNIDAEGKITANALTSDIFLVTEETITVSGSSTGASANSKAVTNTGYYPLGVVGTNVGTAGAYSRGFYLSNVADGSCTLNARLHIASTGNKTCTAYILWLKTSA